MQAGLPRVDCGRNQPEAEFFDAVGVECPYLNSRPDTAVLKSLFGRGVSGDGLDHRQMPLGWLDVAAGAEALPTGFFCKV